MTPIKRPLASAGAAVLLALSLTACGGGAPTDASVKDFCDAVSGSSSDAAFTKAFTDKDWDKLADLVKEQADDLEKVGTPKDISDDAREGFEIQLDAAKDIDADDIEEALTKGGDENPFEADLSSDEKKKVEAFSEYQAKTCSGSTDSGDDSGDSSDQPTEVPTDLPTEVPSDLPTSPEDLESLLSDLPSDLPTDLESLLSDLPSQ